MTPAGAQFLALACRVGAQLRELLSVRRGQALALLHTADAARGARQNRTAALVGVLLFTGARVGEVIGADIEDLGTEQGHRVLRVARGDGQRRTLALPGPAAARIDAYLSGRADLASARRRRGADPGGQRGPDIGGQRSADIGGQHDWPAGQPLFVTRTGRRLFPGDVWRLIRALRPAAARARWSAWRGGRRVPGRPARLARPYSPTSAGVPPVIRISSANEVGNTVCGWAAAAHTMSYLSSHVSTSVRIGAGCPTGATPPMACPVHSRTERASARSYRRRPDQRRHSRHIEPGARRWS